MGGTNPMTGYDAGSCGSGPIAPASAAGNRRSLGGIHDVEWLGEIIDRFGDGSGIDR